MDTIFWDDCSEGWVSKLTFNSQNIQECHRTMSLPKFILNPMDITLEIPIIHIKIKEQDHVNEIENKLTHKH